MAPITENTSDLYRDHLAEDPPVEGVKSQGQIFASTGTVANAADDLNGSSYKLAAIPSDALLFAGTYFDVENWGFAAIRIGTSSDVDALVSQTKATENIIDPIVQGDANHGKRVWEILGLSEDPGGLIDIVAHAIADATGAGSMDFQIAWIHNP